MDKYEALGRPSTPAMEWRRSTTALAGPQHRPGVQL